MLFIVILLIIALLILLIRFMLLKRDMKKTTHELERIRTKETDEFIHINLGNQTLEQLIVELNYLIESKQDVRSAAVRSEQELTNMITSMSHDLRTPLTAIIGYIQLLENENVSFEERQSYISIIHNRADQLYNLIQSLFALSSIQNVEEKLDLELVSLKDCVESVALLYYDAFQQNNQLVDLTIPDESCHVIGDATACKRIIENLIVNALQHAGKQVTMKLERNKRNISFTVRNTLQTTNRLDSNRLFDRLYTGDQTRKHHRGFGLSIVEKLMKQMNGYVFAQIEDDHFTITCSWKVQKNL